MQALSANNLSLVRIGTNDAQVKAINYERSIGRRSLLQHAMEAHH